MRALPLCAVLAGCTFGADFAGTAYLCPAGDCPSGYTCADGRCVSGGEPVDAAPPVSWWDPDWRLRRPLAIRNLSGAPLADGFQVGWRADLESALGDPAGLDFDAVRVVAYDPGSDDWTEIPRVIDGVVVTDEVVWFPLQSSLERDQETVVWIYYDNPNPPAAPWAGTDVFELSDPLASLSDQRWVVTGAVIDEGDEIRLDSTAEVRSQDPWPVDRAVDFVVRVSPDATRLWFGFQREVPDVQASVPWLLWIRRAAGDGIQPEYAGPDDTVETRWSGAIVPIGNDPHVFTVERFLDRVVYRLDYAAAADDHDHVLDQDHSAPLFVRFSNTGSSSFWASRVRIRQVAYPPPAVSLGEPEAPAGR